MHKNDLESVYPSQIPRAHPQRFESSELVLGSETCIFNKQLRGVGGRWTADCAWRNTAWLGQEAEVKEPLRSLRSPKVVSSQGLTPSLGASTDDMKRGSP